MPANAWNVLCIQRSARRALWCDAVARDLALEPVAWLALDLDTCVDLRAALAGPGFPGALPAVDFRACVFLPFCLVPAVVFVCLCCSPLPHLTKPSRKNCFLLLLFSVSLSLLWLLYATLSL